VYVEYLIASVPVFVLFLSICQICLIAAAKLVVGHAATIATRSAIVVLEDDPEHYGGALRGSLGAGAAGEDNALRLLLQRLVGRAVAVSELGYESDGAGPRLQAIRNAAYVPLASLAPPLAFLDFSVGADRGSLGRMLRNRESRLASGLLLYGRAAASVTLREGPNSERVAHEPIDPQQTVTVRVAYLYACAVPIAARLVCRAGHDVLARFEDQAFGRAQHSDRRREADDAVRPRRINHRPTGYAVELPGLRLALLRSAQRFVVLEAEATLPNQGASYYQGGAASRGATGSARVARASTSSVPALEVGAPESTGGGASLAENAASPATDHGEAPEGTTGRTVIGEFPEYIQKANEKRARYFDSRPYDNEAVRWAANRQFLDTISSAGDQVYVSTPKPAVGRESSLAREVEYLTEQRGYRWINQWSLVPAAEAHWLRRRPRQ
jgi:hypothetical protein